MARTKTAFRRKKLKLVSGGTPFQELCGLPANVGVMGLTRKNVLNLLSYPKCCGGIADKLNFGKPKPKKVSGKPRK